MLSLLLAAPINLRVNGCDGRSAAAAVVANVLRPAAALLRAHTIAARFGPLLLVVRNREPEAAGHRIGFDDPQFQLLA
jgi:hypothetical protein